MTIGTKHIQINNINWHCLSIFYARKNFAVLLDSINNFCEINNNLLKHWSMYFSDDQGERVNLVFISEMRNSEKLIMMIEQYFKKFLEEKPSEKTYSAASSSVFWLAYPNNSLVWNGFHIPDFLFDSQELRDFCQDTSLLITNMYDAENSYEGNAVSIGLFLIVQAWKLQNIDLPKIANPELAEIMQSYWEYDEKDCLASWLAHKNIADRTLMIRSNLNLSDEIFNLLGFKKETY